MPTKCFCYLRVSGQSQVETDGFIRQELAVRKHAEANGLEIVRVFREEAVPGSTDWESRPAWLEMIQALNGVRTIVIERLDRLARDLIVQEKIILDLQKRDVDLQSTVEPDLCSTEPTRVLMRQLIGSICQYEKACIVLKLRGARNRKKSAEGRCEGCKPYGHYPGESTTLSAMIELREAGYPSAAIARDLNAKSIANRKGGKWHPFSVQRILEAQEVKAC